MSDKKWSYLLPSPKRRISFPRLLIKNSCRLMIISTTMIGKSNKKVCSIVSIFSSSQSKMMTKCFITIDKIIKEEFLKVFSQILILKGLWRLDKSRIKCQNLFWENKINRLRHYPTKFHSSPIFRIWNLDWNRTTQIKKSLN